MGGRGPMQTERIDSASIPVAELADAQDLGWFPSKSHVELIAIPCDSHGAFGHPRAQFGTAARGRRIGRAGKTDGNGKDENMRKIAFGLLACLLAAGAQARQRAFGYCQQRVQAGAVSGLTGSPFVQASYPSCTVKVMFAGLPGTVAISSISRSSNVVTVVLSSSTTNLIVDARVTIAGVTDSSYNGDFTVATVTVSSNTFTYNQTGSNGSSWGGTSLFTPVLYSDRLGTILENPFTATPSGSWSFYADNTRYDVATSEGGPSSSVTVGRVLFADLLGQNAITAYKINTKILVDNNRFLTPEAALAACPASPIGCYVEHTDFSSTSAGFTVGGTPSVGYFGQKFELYPGARIDLQGKVNLLDGGVVFGDDFVSSLLIAGGSFPGATPLVDVGDGVNPLTEQLWNLRLNANLVPGITGIRIRGFNDSSGVWNTTTQNYMANCISMDGTNVLVNNFIMVNNICGGATGAGDAISLNNTNGGELFARTTTVSNSGSQIAGAGLHIAGTSTTGATHTDISHHAEKHNDGDLLNGNGSLTTIGLNCGNGVVNCAHVAPTATGSWVFINTHNNADSASNPVIKDEVCGVTLASINPPAQHGVIPFYMGQAQSGHFSCFWQDANALHYLTDSSSIAPFLLQGGNQLQSWNLAGTVKTVFGAECMAYQQGCLGTLTNHPLKVYTNGTLAATFDSSQNFLVTGNVTVGGSLAIGSGGGLTSTGAGGTMESLIAAGTLRIVPRNTVGCVDQTATAPGATTAMKVVVSPVSPQNNITWAGYVSTSNTVDIRVCTIVALLGRATTFNWSVIP